MAWVTGLALLCVLHLSRTEDCVIDNRSLDILWEKQLHSDLSANHSKKEPPQIVGSEIKLLIIMRYFHLDEESEKFSMYSWTVLTWFDTRLTWNPKDYGGLNKTFLYSHLYWSPMLMLTNVLETDEFDTFYGMCKLNFLGKVTCRPKITHTSRCISVLTKWPYDAQNCTVEYSLSTKVSVRLVPKDKRFVSMMGAEYGNDWTIMDYHEIMNASNTSQIKIVFTLERNAEGLAAMIIVPAFLLSTLTITVSVLDATKFTRFWLSCFSVLCHFTFLSTISSNIPKHSSNTPTIIMFYMSSLMISVFLVLFSFVLKSLRNRPTVIPSLISTTNKFVFSSFGKYLIWPRWKTDPVVASSGRVSVDDLDAWNDFASFLNTIAICVYIVSYSILIPLYVPRPPVIVT